MTRRVVATVVVAAVGVGGALLMLEREERHFLRHALPLSLAVGVLLAALTWLVSGEDGFH